MTAVSQAVLSTLAVALAAFHASAQTTPLVVSKIGVGADIFEFAHRHSAAYGIIAIVMALLAGWAAHLVFRRI